jgi:putative transposase
MTDIGRKIPDQNVHISLSSANIVFLTVCTKNREPWLAQAAVQNALESIWKNARAWMVGRYVLMPDHLHLFCAPYDLKVTLQAWVTYWKRRFSRLQLPGTGGWQRLSWHHRLRSDENYDEKWEYVRNNPIRAGLGETPDDWPYQGEPNTLRW